MFLGGVVGLWTGFSALALAELMSLLISVLLYAFGCTKGDIEKKENKVSIPKKSKNNITCRKTVKRAPLTLGPIPL